MPQKRIPTPTQDAGNWGTILNDHLSQTKNPINGAFNSFDQFSQRPTNLTADDAGRTYLYTQTGNWHEWSGTEWKVQNKSEINVKDYGAVGDGVVDDTLALQKAIDLVENSFPDWFASTSLNGTAKIFFPRGLFKISSTLKLSRGLTIEGDNGRNNGGSQIYQSNPNASIFDLFGKVNANGQREADQRIQNLHFRSVGGGIRALKSDYPEILSFSMGSLMIINCYFLDINGGYCIDTETLEQLAGNTFDYCEGGGVRCGEIRAVNNVFFTQAKGAIIIDTDRIPNVPANANEYSITQITGNTFYGCGTDSNLVPVPQRSSIGIIGVNPVFNINISSNSFTALSDGTGGFGISSDVSLKNCNISNNIFTQLRGEAIRISKMEYCIVESNNFNRIGNSPSATYITNFSDCNKSIFSKNTFFSCGGIQNIFLTGDNNIIKYNIEDTSRTQISGLNNQI